MGVLELLQREYNVPIKDREKMWRVQGTTWKICRDVAELTARGGRVIKQVLRMCPRQAVHLYFGTPLCHQISALQFRGILGWTGRTSNTIHECALHIRTIMWHMKRPSLCLPFIETSGSIRSNPMHIEYLQDILALRTSIRSTGNYCLTQRVRMWAGPYDPAPQELPSVDSIQGILEPVGPCGEQSRKVFTS